MSNINWCHRFLICPAAQAQLARELCATIAGAGGSGMFTTGLSDTGTEPATHYISAGLLDEQFAALLPLMEITEEGVQIQPGNAGVVAHLGQEAGMDVTVEQVQALFDAAYVSAEPPLEAMERQGLKLVVEAE